MNENIDIKPTIFVPQKLIRHFTKLKNINQSAEFLSIKICACVVVFIYVLFDNGYDLATAIAQLCPANSIN